MTNEDVLLYAETAAELLSEFATHCLDLPMHVKRAEIMVKYWEEMSKTVSKDMSQPK